LPFDLPAAVFYMLSRYEEYLPFEPDVYGRFPAPQSLAFCHGFLDRPIVNEWINALRKILAEKYPQLKMSTAGYSFIPTYDIDMAWAWLERPFWRKLATQTKLFLKGEKELLANRKEVLSYEKKDPYDTFGVLERLNRKWNLEPIYFFHLGDFGKYDRNIHFRRPALRALIKKITDSYPSGIHPSFATLSSHEVLRRSYCARDLKRFRRRPSPY